MASLAGLLGSGASNALQKAGTQAVSKAAQQAGTKALSQAVSKASVPVVQTLLQQGLSKSAANALTKNIASKSTLALSQLLPKNSGSAIDGVINRNTGIILPNAKKNSLSLGELIGTGEKSLAKNIAAGDFEDMLPTILEDAAAGRIPSQYKKPLDSLKSDVVGMARSDRNEMLAGTAGGATSWSDLPKLKTSEVKSLLGESGADIRPSLQGKLSEANGRGIGDPAWAETFPDMVTDAGQGSFSGDINDILDRYESAYNARQVGSDFTDENIAKYLMLNPEKDAEYSQLIADAMNGKRNISINQLLGKGSDVPVSTVTMAGSSTVPDTEAAIAGMKQAEPMVKIAAGTPAADATTIENSVANSNILTPTSGGGIAEAQQNVADTFGLGSGGNAGQGGGGGFRITPAAESDPGFGMPLKTDETKTIKITSQTPKSTAKQRRTSYENQDWLRSINASQSQAKDLLGKSYSFNNYYASPVERARANNLDAANLYDRTEAMIAARQNGVVKAEKYATEQGIRVNLPNIEITQPQAQSLALSGVDIDTLVNTGTATPEEAETLYKMLRDTGNRLERSTDGVAQEMGRAYKNMAKSVSNSLNEAMDAINIDYKTALLQDAANAGEDIKYLQQIANASDFKFSDLRKDMADLITLQDAANRVLKNEKTINIMGIDTGIPNPAGKIGEKIRGKYYEYAEKAEEKAAANAAKKASSAGAGGGSSTKTSASASGAPKGGSGGNNAATGGDYVFEMPEATPSALSGLLGKAKNIAPYAIGAGIGVMAAGGRGGGGDNAEIADIMASSMGNGNTQATRTAADPYQTVTIGGYTYDDLEYGYMAALSAGDTVAAKQIASIMDLLEAKISRAQKAQEDETGGIAAKQQAALNVINGLMQNFEAQGPIGGRFTQFMNGITGGGYNSSAAAYDSGAQGSLGTVIKALGDSGALSEGDQKRALALLPQTTDSAEAAKKKLQQLIQIIKAAGTQ